MDSLRKCKSRCLWLAPVVFFLAKTGGRICSGTTPLKSDELHQAETGTFFFSSSFFSFFPFKKNFFVCFVGFLFVLKNTVSRSLFPDCHNFSFH